MLQVLVSSCSVEVILGGEQEEQRVFFLISFWASEEQLLMQLYQEVLIGRHRSNPVLMWTDARNTVA